MKKPKTSWGNVAGWYDNLLEKSPDSYQEKVILPNLLRIVDPKPGQKILDIACGQGYFSRILAKNGAQVTGCDISSELIELAKKNSPKEITYFVAPAEKIIDPDTANAEKSFDTAIIVLAIQNIEDMRAAFSESARLLKSPDSKLGTTGRLIIVINHPIFRIPQNSSWEWDAKAHKQYRRIDSYMTDNKIKIDMAPGGGAKGKAQTISFHRPLQGYFKALNSAGFAVTRLEEWISHKQSQEGPRAQEEDRTRKEIPLFMCIEARKL
ncbi:MAG: class I SAM-dependent methyltransferase [Candidatus Taylorbacteria bacterium]